MATLHTLDDDNTELKKVLTRSLQSGHINILLGAGASQPAVPTAGPIEKRINDLIAAGDEDAARTAMYEFLCGVHAPVVELLSATQSAAVQQSLKQYETFLATLEHALNQRRTTILPRHATVFTTNYDLFMEKAAAACPSAILNTGFARVPSLGSDAEYSPQAFFMSTFATGSLYDYRVELPTINLIKLHGCLSWKAANNKILLGSAAYTPVADPTDAVAVQQFIMTYSVVLPEIAKYNATVLNRTYYELLRTFANELEKENVLLLTFGFSFNDEHIQHLVKRALRNPTLKLLVAAYDETEAASLADKFIANPNVGIIRVEDGAVLDFPRFNELLASSVPMAEEWR